jgi:hypothetical protein
MAGRHFPKLMACTCSILGFALFLSIAGCNQRTPQQQLYVMVAKGDITAVRRLLDDTAHVTAN